MYHFLWQGGQSEVEKEQRKQDQQEENYSFVWGQNKLTASDNVIADSDSDTDVQSDKDVIGTVSDTLEADNEES